MPPVAAVLLGMALASGCAGATAGGPPPAPPPPLSVPLPSPALSGGGAVSDVDLLYQAEQILVRDCMARQGLTYRPTPRTPVPDMERFPYVVDDLEWAQANGYGRAARRKAEQSTTAAANYYRGLPPARQRAWLIAFHGERGPGLEAQMPTGGKVGHSDKGCAAQAWQELYGDMRQWYRVSRVTQTLDSMRVAQTQQNPRYVAARERWRECMRSEGFSVPAPVALRGRQLAYRGADAEARDRKAATAEAKCALSSGLSKAAHELDAANGAALRRRYRSEFDTAERLRTAALPRARALVGTPP
ncbi:hypothetical protein [Streptosporangium sp. NPDC051022]|uniref:hypothetical protein n=1 Tax=Streptosporangium sp. NPDC051022 TaxID=3155752 RepID=UPI00341D48F1